MSVITDEERARKLVGKYGPSTIAMLRPVEGREDKFADTISRLDEAMISAIASALTEARREEREAAERLQAAGRKGWRPMRVKYNETLIFLRVVDEVLRPLAQHADVADEVAQGDSEPVTIFPPLCRAAREHIANISELLGGIPRFMPGDRVRLTAEGARALPQFSSRIGTIARFSRQIDFAMVCWDGSSILRTINEDLIERWPSTARHPPPAAGE